MSASILVVDDDPPLLRSLAAILRREGYSVTEAASGKEAAHLLSAGAYDLIFLDIQMPGLDGLALLGEIHRSFPHLPVLILTGHASLESSIEAVRQGARDYLLKPVDPQRILARVRDVLEEARQPERRRALIDQIQGLIAELRGIDGADEDAILTLASSLPATSSSRFLRRGRLTLDLHARLVTLEGRLIHLPPTDFLYLAVLARSAPEPVSFEALVARAQGYEVSRREAQELARWHMHRIRRAIEPDPAKPSLLLTVRGFGYRLLSQ